MSTKPSHALTMRDRLSHLSFEAACKLLGPQGKRLLLEGGALELESPDDLRVDDGEAVVAWGKSVPAGGAIARLVLDPLSRAQLRASCSICDAACLHVGGLLAHVLENKSGLGLAEPPPDVTLEGLFGDEALGAAALTLREERAKSERMKIRSADATRPWTDYTATSLGSGKTYRVALRGEARGVSYCSCPDFKTSTLGTCKHVMKVLAWAKKRFPARDLEKPYRRTRITIHLRYAEKGASLAIALPTKLSEPARAVVAPLLHGSPELPALLDALGKLTSMGQALFVTPDAEEFIERALVRARVAKVVAEIRKAPAKHPLQKGLLRET